MKKVTANYEIISPGLSSKYLSVKFSVERDLTEEVMNTFLTFPGDTSEYATRMPYRCDKDHVNIAGILEEWRAALEEQDFHYIKMMRFGSARNVATSDITITATYCSWHTFFKEYAMSVKQEQLRQLMPNLFNDIKAVSPSIFQDISLTIISNNEEEES